MKRRIFFVVLVLEVLLQACVPNLPKAAKDLAISALCDFPTYSGNNRCRKVDINQVVMTSISGNHTDEDSRIWCIELNFVDYTGESGFACVWLIGPSEIGEFKLTEGPLFNEKCTGLN
jgi:hypothetical protein